MTGLVLAGHIRPVALIEGARVAVVGARGARRSPGVGGTVRARPRAVLVLIALAGGGATDRG